MFKYVIEFGEQIPDQEMFNYQDIDIIDAQKLESQINMNRKKERDLLNLYDSLQYDLIMARKKLSRKNIQITSEHSDDAKEKVRLLKEDPDIIEMKDNIEGIKMSLDTVLKELDFVKSDLYILRTSMYQKFNK